MGFPMAVQGGGRLLTRLPRSVSVSVTENGLALMHEAHLETFGSNKNGGKVPIVEVVLSGISSTRWLSFVYFPWEPCLEAKTLQSWVSDDFLSFMSVSWFFQVQKSFPTNHFQVLLLLVSGRVHGHIMMNIYIIYIYIQYTVYYWFIYIYIYLNDVMFTTLCRWESQPYILSMITTWDGAKNRRK